MKRIRCLLATMLLVLASAASGLSTSFSTQVPCVNQPFAGGTAYTVNASDSYIASRGNIITNDGYMIVVTDCVRPVGREIAGEMQLMAIRLSDGTAFWLKPISSESPASYPLGHYDFPNHVGYAVDPVNNIVVYRTIGGHFLKSVNLNTGIETSLMTFSEGTIYDAPQFLADGTFAVNVVHYGPNETEMLGGMTSVIYKLTLNVSGAIENVEILHTQIASKNSDGNINLDLMAAIDPTCAKSVWVRGIFDNTTSLQSVGGLFFADDYGKKQCIIAQNIDFQRLPEVYFSADSKFVYYSTGLRVARSGSSVLGTQFWTITPKVSQKLSYIRKNISSGRSLLPTTTLPNQNIDFAFHPDTEAIFYIEQAGGICALKRLVPTDATVRVLAVNNGEGSLENIGFTADGFTLSANLDNKFTVVVLPLGS